MKNFYEFVKESLHFNKFEIENTICVEYKCPLGDEQTSICSQSDYIVHVLSGKKTWKTIYGDWPMEPGDTLYVKKGANIIEQFFEDEFCLLGFFISDNLIRDSINEFCTTAVLSPHDTTPAFTATALKSNDSLEGFFQSMLIYFRGEQPPQEYILKLKLKELIANIFCISENAQLASYLKTVASNSKPSLPQIMELNYRYNLSLEEFAKLCHRSLSSFKRDFQTHYNTSPGKWLLSKRLDHSANLLLGNYANITQIAFESGFEDVSHFSHAFRQKFGISPKEYRKVTA